MSVRVAVDAMGGDHAPDAVVDGALRAHVADGVDVVLVGDPDHLARALARAGAPAGLPVVAAAHAVGMLEDPALALRAKPDASVRVAARLVATGEAQAVLSAGSTGATLAAALLELGRVPSVRRPVVAAVLPVGAHGVVLLDAGGSSDAQAEALEASARMGAAYARARGVAAPRVGLLNVGEEPGKGNALAKEAFARLEGTVGFVGNVEPGAVLRGAADVVVTDGFTGNVFLKTVEALAQARGAGAALLLGVGGEVLIAHGGAQADEIADGLRMAVAVAGLSGRIAELLTAPA